MLARIMLRLEVGREPTGDEVDNQIEKLKEKSVSLPSFGVITAAFENGEEVCPFCCVFIFGLPTSVRYRKYTLGNLSATITKRISKWKSLSYSRTTRRRLSDRRNNVRLAYMRNCMNIQSDLNRGGTG